MCVSGAGNKSVVEGGGDIAAVLNRNTSLVNLDLNCEAMAGVCVNFYYLTPTTPQPQWCQNYALSNTTTPESLSERVSMRVCVCVCFYACQYVCVCLFL